MWMPVRHRLQRLRVLRVRASSLRPVDWWVVVQALLWVVVVRVSLYLMPFSWIPRAMKRLHSLLPSSESNGEVTPQGITWAVARVGHRIPKATCLTQALAARILLNRYGYNNHLCIGVSITDDKGFQAHAWLEGEQGQVLIGQLLDLDSYTKLPLESARIVF